MTKVGLEESAVAKMTKFVCVNVCMKKNVFT